MASRIKFEISRITFKLFYSRSASRLMKFYFTIIETSENIDWTTYEVKLKLLLKDYCNLRYYYLNEDFTLLSSQLFRDNRLLKPLVELYDQLSTWLKVSLSSNFRFYYKVTIKLPYEKMQRKQINVICGYPNLLGFVHSVK